MKISVIGTIMRDEIHTVNGERRESFGGILYNVMALAAMTRRSDEIQPMCYIGKDHLEFISQRYFQANPQIVSDSISLSSKGTDENILRYRTSSDREEQMTINTPSLSPEGLEAAGNANAILINFINGREITLDALRHLRNKTNAHLHLDVHNLGKEINEQGKLTPKGLPNWRDWFSLVDTVQANEWEVQLINGKKPTSEDEFRESVLEFISVPNLKAAALTVGGMGCLLAHRMADDKKVRIVRIPAIQVKDVVDTTGCGDCFSSAFVLEMLRSGNPIKAGLMSTTLSGLNTLGGGLEDLALRASGLRNSTLSSFRNLWRKTESGWLGDEP